MKVKELIIKLQAANPEGEVFISCEPDFKYEDDPILFNVEKVDLSMKSIAVRIYQGERLE